MKLSKARLLDMYNKMLLTRFFEEQVDAFFAKGMIHGTTHLSIGQEAFAIGATSVLKEGDLITSTHRGHGECIGKNADVNLMMAELMGKVTGYCKGKGGSMHIADLEQGNLGANGVVGGGIPIATGAALTQKMKQNRIRSYCVSWGTEQPIRAYSMNPSIWLRSGSCLWSICAPTTSTECPSRSKTPWR